MNNITLSSSKTSLETPADLNQNGENTALTIVNINLQFSSMQAESEKLKKNVIPCAFKGCNKKILEIHKEIRTCYCKQIFCPNHLFFKAHKCTFDYKKQNKTKLEQALHSHEKKRRVDQGFYSPGNQHAY
jgi:hypothetical protein